MAIALEGLLGGITALSIILSSAIFGLLSLYKSFKLKAKLLAIAALTMFFVGFLWLGPTIDFFSKAFTAVSYTHLRAHVLLSYMWVAPALFFAVYLGGELLLPKYKWYLVAIFLVLGIIFEIFLWSSPLQSFDNDISVRGTDGIIDASFNLTHPTFILFATFLISALIFLGIGFAIKAKQSTGLLKKKFIFLSIGFIIFVVCGALDSIITEPVVVGVIRLAMVTFALFMYLGLKT